METDLRNYKPEELVGKLVMYESGMSFDSSYSKKITTIEKVNKTGYRIKLKRANGEEFVSDAMFSLIDGSQKGLTGRQNMGTHSRCYLITEEEANELRATWRKTRETKEMREKIKTSIDGLSYDKLKEILNLL